MTPRFLTESQRRKLQLKKEVFNAYTRMAKDGSTPAAIYKELSQVYGIAEGTVRNYVIHFINK